MYCTSGNLDYKSLLRGPTLVATSGNIAEAAQRPGIEKLRNQLANLARLLDRAKEEEFHSADEYSTLIDQLRTATELDATR